MSEELKPDTYYWAVLPSEGDVFTPAYHRADGEILIDGEWYKGKDVSALQFHEAVMPSTRNVSAEVDSELINLCKALNRFTCDPSDKRMIYTQAEKLIQSQAQQIEQLEAIISHHNKTIDRLQDEGDKKDRFNALLQSQLAEANKLIETIHDELMYGDVYGWNDGQPVWEAMKYYANQLRTDK